MINPHWTADEINLLRQCCIDDKSLFETQSVLDRSPLAIILKARSLSPALGDKCKAYGEIKMLLKDESKALNDIYKKRNSRWTEQDESNLIFLFEKQRCSINEIAEHFDRSESSICDRLKILYPTIYSLNKIWDDCKKFIRLERIESLESIQKPADQKIALSKWVKDIQTEHSQILFHKQHYCENDCVFSILKVKPKCKYLLSQIKYKTDVFVACSYLEKCK